jgi:EthD domain
MIKFIPAFTNRNDISRDECRWRHSTGHASLAATADTFNRHMPKYVQNYVIDDVRGMSSNPVRTTGLSECWFYSIEGFWDAFAEPRYADFRVDEQRFLDINDLLLVFASAATIFGRGQDSSFKFFKFYSRKSSVSAKEFRHCWENEFAAAATFDTGLRGVTRAYVQNRPIEGVSHTFPVSRTCDAVDEFWIDDLDVLPGSIDADRDLSEKVGLASLTNSSVTEEVVTRTKVLWDLGERPLTALPKIAITESR